MSTPELPTPYELARIAAAVYREKTGVTASATLALTIWNAVIQEINKEKAKEQAPPKIYSISDENAADAIEWLHLNASDKDDKLKNPKKLFAAFKEFNSERDVLQKRIRKKKKFEVREEELKRFLEYRRLKRNATRNENRTPKERQI